jgi:hypothetical protein
MDLMLSAEAERFAGARIEAVLDAGASKSSLWRFLALLKSILRRVDG